MLPRITATAERRMRAARAGGALVQFARYDLNRHNRRASWYARSVGEAGAGEQDRD